MSPGTQQASRAVPCAVETIGISKSYPRTRRYRDLLLHPFRSEKTVALDGVDLRLEEGQLVGLLGPNGAGKTTLIKILCTLVLPTNGKAFVGGFDVTRQEKRVRRVAGLVVSEDRSFYWRLTGRQNLEFFATLNNLPPGSERVERVVEILGLGEHIDRMFKDYSSGLKQRLAIARALLADPQILFLDEPTKTLDPIISRSLLHLIRHTLVDEQKRTVVFSTNNVLEVEGFFDHLVVLDRGRVALSAPTRDLPRLFGSEETHVLRVRHPRSGVEELLRSATGIGDRAPEFLDPTTGDDVRFRISCNGNISAVIDLLVKAGVHVHACTPEKVSLDDVFERIVRDGIARRS